MIVTPIRNDPGRVRSMHDVWPGNVLLHMQDWGNGDAGPDGVNWDAALTTSGNG